MHKIEINKHIPHERWGEFFGMFTHANKGRLIEIELVDYEKGDQVLIQSAALSSIDYQPLEEANSIIIAAGQDSSVYTHIIDEPIEVWTGQDENGVVMAMNITDKRGNHIIIKLAEITVP